MEKQSSGIPSEKGPTNCNENGIRASSSHRIREVLGSQDILPASSIKEGALGSYDARVRMLNKYTKPPLRRRRSVGQL